MPGARELGELADEISRAGNDKKGAPTLRLRQGVVLAVNVGPASVDIQVGGDTSTTIPGVRYLASYTPSGGDTVWVLQSGSVLLVLGDLA